MPRKKRIYLPGMAYHLVQRGNNRKACFFSEEDYSLYRELLKDYGRRYGVDVHAYALMTNHIHLLLTPEFEGSVSRMMQSLGSRYAYFINKRYKRSGTIWEGRHKSSAVDSENYLLKCYRYIELNPVRAGMVRSPEDYQWTSYRVNGWGEKSDWLVPHKEYLKLGANSEVRCFAYRKLFKGQLDVDDLYRIRKATYFNHPLGDERFVEEVENCGGIKVGYAGYGRPGNQVTK